MWCGYGVWCGYDVAVVGSSAVILHCSTVLMKFSEFTLCANQRVEFEESGDQIDLRFSVLSS